MVLCFSTSSVVWTFSFRFSSSSWSLCSFRNLWASSSLLRALVNSSQTLSNFSLDTRFFAYWKNKKKEGEDVSWSWMIFNFWNTTNIEHKRQLSTILICWVPVINKVQRSLFQNDKYFPHLATTCMRNKVWRSQGRSYRLVWLSHLKWFSEWNEQYLT